MRAYERVLGLDGVGEHAHHREVGGAQLALKVMVLEHGAGVVAQSEQNVVIELLEATLSVRADDHAVEVIAHVDGDRHEVLDLLVGGCMAVARRVLAHNLLALQDTVRETLSQRGGAGVALEAAVADEIEVAVAVRVALGEQHALLATSPSTKCMSST